MPLQSLDTSVPNRKFVTFNLTLTLLKPTVVIPIQPPASILQA